MFKLPHLMKILCLISISISILSLTVFCSIPPHPRVEKMIKDGVIPVPYHLKYKEDAMKRGINVLPDQISKRSNRVFAVKEISTLKAIAILVKFSDKPSQVQAVFFDSLLYGATGHTLRNYYNEVTYDSLDIVTVNFPSSMGWMDAPQSYSYYTNGNNGFGAYPQNAQKLAEDAINAVNSVVDFSDYDNDGDGYVDALFIIHAGPGAEYTGNPNDIWSHQWATYSPMLVDGVYAYVYSTEPEYWLSPGDMTCGVYAHEAGHSMFGLPDLYDYGYDSRGLGDWSLMAFGSWNGPLGSSPAHPDAWSRWKMGYATKVNITSDTNSFNIWAVEDTSKVYTLWTDGISSTEYFLVENRQRIGYDTYLPGDGLCIYHIDEVKTGNNDQWYPGGDPLQHYKVALEQADGLWDLEQNFNSGDGGDPFPGIENRRNFDSSSTHNTNCYNGKRSFIAVKNISNSNSMMTADFLVKTVYPEIDITPLSFAVTVAAGDTAQRDMVIRNQGPGELDFQFALSPNTILHSVNAGKNTTVSFYPMTNELQKYGDIPNVDGSGGPDSLGYTWIDSDQPGGPTFNWIDITGIGTPVTLPYLGSAGYIPVGFNFKYYGNTYSQVAINASAFLSFTMSESWIPIFDRLPSEWNPTNMVALMAADLDPIGNCYYYPDALNDRFIVEYYNWDGYYTMEVIIYKDGRILFQYLNMSGSAHGIVGIQNYTRDVGLNIRSTNIKNNYAIEFRITPKWISAMPSSGTIVPNDSQKVTLIFDSHGVSPGVYDGTLSVASNDSNESSVPILLNFTILDQANITASMDTIDFGSLYVGYTYAETLNIGNSGSQPLFCHDILVDNPAFNIDRTSLSLLPDNMGFIAVTFTPPATGDFFGILIIKNNDPQDSILYILLKGKATYPPVISVPSDTMSFYVQYSESRAGAFRISNAGLSDLNFAISVQPESMIIGDSISAIIGADILRGNILSVIEPTGLVKTNFFLDIPTNTDLHYAVYESDKISGPFYRIFMKSVSNVGTGRRFYSSGEMNTTLYPGKYYLIAVASSDSITFYHQSQALPYNTKWGNIYSEGWINHSPPLLFFTPILATTGLYYQVIEFSENFISSVSPDTDVVSPDNYKDVTVCVAGDRRIGTHYSSLKITNNDPFSSIRSIPVKMIVKTPGIEVEEGWNLVSLPMQVADARKSILFPMSESNAYGFKMSYLAQDTILNGMGCWLKFPSQDTIDFQGDEILADTFNVIPRWNLIGSLTYPVPISQVNAVSPISVLSGFIGYSSQLGYYNADTLKPGYGYWLKVDTSGSLVVSSSVINGLFIKPSTQNDYIKTQSMMTPMIANLEGISSLTFTDGRTKKRTIYFASKEKQISVELFDLPPSPPPQVFDVRFASQRNIEIAGENDRSFPVLINGFESPLTISWDIKEQSMFASLQIDDKIIQMEGNGSDQIMNHPSKIVLKLNSENDIPKEFSLIQNYPNPFNPNTIIRYQIPTYSRVTLKVYTVLGEEVKTLVNGVEDAGYKSVEWNAKDNSGNDISSGVYIYRIEATSILDPNNTFMHVRKMILLR